MTWLLNVRHLLVQSFIITLHLCVFLFESWAFRLVKVTSLLHPLGLKLSFLDFSSQLLYLSFMCVVILKLLNLLLKSIYKSILWLNFLLKAFLVIFKTFHLLFERFHSLFDLKVAALSRMLLTTFDLANVSGWGWAYLRWRQRHLGYHF